jgi:hypothetical protein
MKKLTHSEKNILLLADSLITKHYKKRAAQCRQFKYICHKHLPQTGPEYEKNKNIFEIQDKTLAELEEEKMKAHQLIYTLMKEL